MSYYFSQYNHQKHGVSVYICHAKQVFSINEIIL